MTKRLLVVLVGLFFLSWLVRLLFIGHFPLFNDESIYIRWGILMVQNEQFRHASLSYFGKHPFSFWVFGGIASLFQHAYAARFVPWLLFLGSSILFYFLLTRLTRSDRHILFVFCLFLFSPFTLLFHSVALMESLLIPLLLLLLLMCVEYRKTRSTLLVCASVGVLGISLLVKYNTIIFVGVIPLLLLEQFFLGTNKNRILLQGILFSVLMGIVIILFSSSIVSSTQETQKYLFSVKELLEFPVDYWIRSLWILVGGIVLYSPMHILLLRVGMLKKESWLYVLFFLIGTVPIIIFGKIVSFRYFLPGFLFLYPVLIEASRGYSLRKYVMGSVISVSAFFLLVVSPVHFFSVIPEGSYLQSERDYVFGRAGGYTARWVVSFVDQEYPTSILVVPDDPGNPIDYIRARYAFSSHVQVVIASTDDELKRIESLSLQVPVLYIDRVERMSADIRSRLSLIKRFDSPDGKSTIEVYEL